MNIRFLRDLQKVQRPKDLVGRWVIEFSCEINGYEDSQGWRQLRFGIYKVLTPGFQGGQFIYQHNITGFMREYRIWLPWYRVQ